MKTSFKIIGISFLLVIILVGIWFSLDSDIKCKLIYGKNICNFYEMMNIQPSVTNFERMMNLCREMSDVPKKDSCFEYIAEIFSPIAIEKVKQACSEIKEFEGVHSKENCYIKIQKSAEEKLVEGAVVEFMEARLQKDIERVSIWLTDDAKQQYAQPGLTLLGTSNPHFSSYELLETEKLDSGQFKFKVRIYEEYTGEGRVGYFNETLTLIKSGDKYLIDSVERSEYTNL